MKPKSPRRPQYWIGGLVLLINIAMASAALTWLDYNKMRYHQEAADVATNIGRIMEVSVTTAIRGIDLALQSMATEIARCPVMGAPTCTPLAQVAAERSRGLTEAQAFFIANASGQVLAGQSHTIKMGNSLVNVSDRDYFKRLQADPSDRLVVSQPNFGKVTKRWVLNVVRPILSSDKRFLGVVIGSIDLEYLQKMLQSIDLGAHGAISLRDSEMGVILRVPEPKGIGTNIGSKNISPQLAAMLEQKLTSGVYRAVTPLDGIERTVAFTRSSAYPLYVNVGLSAEDYLAQWKKEQQAVIGALLFLCLLTSASGWYSWRLYHRQALEAEQRLVAVRQLEQAQKEITELNAGLEQRVASRTSELASANRQLKETLDHLEFTRDELVRSEKMASLGAMVAGVAHELNTPIGNALLVAGSIHEESIGFAAESSGKLTRQSLKDFLDKTVHGADMLIGNLRRAADLITGFKQLSIDQTSDQRRAFSLLEVSKEVAMALHPTIKKTRHQLEIDIAETLVIDSYPGAFGQVLSNLVNNALSHAFTEDKPGTMKISASPYSMTEIQVHFSDNGAGMSPEIFRRVFDPFFTTKLGKGGSGLGMHIVYNLISNTLGGRISGTSTPGEGTHWTIILPRAAPLPDDVLSA